MVVITKQFVMRRSSLFLFLFSMLTISAVFTWSACSGDGGGVNIFSVEDDKMLGMQLRDEILANPQEFPVLDEVQYASAYGYLNDVVDDILASGEVRYAEAFAWETRIIENDTVLNAFAAPGGYIFVYTGLIKFLEKKDDFVGVMGHEMAHADRRHSTQQLTQQYGVAVLLELLVGNNESLLGNVLGSLLTLKFSRDDEAEADEYSVIYLCDTEYAANGAASFFEALLNMGVATPPQFLSTHPSPDNRVADINAEADSRGCDTTFDSNDQEWEAFKASLP